MERVGKRLAATLPAWVGTVITFACLVATVSVAGAAGDANVGVCDNESVPGFRAYLPDCRAYEMVSPGFKAGGEPATIIGPSSDGHILMESLGGFSGIEGDTLGGYYDLNRTNAGWQSAAINPPASQFPAGTFFAASTDLSKTLWALRSASQSVYAQDLYVREPNGTLAKVGPMAPPSATGGPPAGGFQLFVGQYHYAGASSNLSHILFSVENLFGTALWPGDETAEEGIGREGGTSLYGYVNTGNTRPQLIGVTSEGSQITTCSTSLGAERENDTYNAVAADGEKVFFTARGHSESECVNPHAPEVTELYARIDNSETVPVSEPSPTQCEGCNIAEKAPAELQGASADGSKVFFLTTQPLLEDAETTNLYEYDFDSPRRSRILRVSSGSATPEVQGVVRVSQDGTHVYFVARASLTVGGNREGASPVSGEDNLYLFERDEKYPQGRLTYIATLGEGDAQDWAAEDAREAQATPNGRFLVFASSRDLTVNDSSTETQIFEYDAVREELARVSVGQRGYVQGAASADDNEALMSVQHYSGAARPADAESNIALSEDGADVVFASAGALTPGAEDAAAAHATSVYEYQSNGVLANGDVYLLSDGTNVRDAETRGLSMNSDDALLITGDPLIPSDGDTQADLYDARSEGGFPAEAPVAECDGEQCHGGGSSQPKFGVVASAGMSGEAGLQQNAGMPSNPSATKPVTSVMKLTTALKMCRRRYTRKRRRAACESKARQLYRRELAHAHGKAGQR